MVKQLLLPPDSDENPETEVVECEKLKQRIRVHQDNLENYRNSELFLFINYDILMSKLIFMAIILYQLYLDHGRFFQLEKSWVEHDPDRRRIEVNAV